MIRFKIPNPYSRAATWILLGLSLLLSTGSRAAEIPGYHDYEALTQALRETVAAHPSLARLKSAGTTLEGREIWVVELGSDVGLPRETRPALFIGANFEGDQLVGSELSLMVVQYLLDHYATDEMVKQRLDNYTYYIFPRVNPDGAEHHFMDLQTGQSFNSNPFDDDNDGRTDEDGPEDLDGNGMITVMRVLNPGGKYMIDPANGQTMKIADPKKGEKGSYDIYWEGRDNDGDGFYNEDPVGGVNINRNFQHQYPYYERAAGIHMVSERESRAIMDFVIDHRNIAMILVFGANDNLVVAPNTRGELAEARNISLFRFADESFSDALDVGMFSSQQSFRGGFGGGQGGQGGQQAQAGSQSGRRPATTVNPDDLEYFTAVSAKYRELTGIKSTPGIDKPAGAFFEYGYYQFGVPSFSTPGWGLPDQSADSSDTTRSPRGAGARGTGDGENSTGTPLDVALLKWMEADGIDGFVPWHSFLHPSLGDVEIGGFKPYVAINPPFEVIEELGPKQGAFVTHLSSLFAEVRIAKTEVIDHGGGVFRIKAEIENSGFLPTSLAHGVVSRSVKPTMVQLDIDPENLLSGAAKTSFFQTLDGSGNRESFEWLIKGKRGDRVELKVVSQKGGTDSTRLTLE